MCHIYIYIYIMQSFVIWDPFNLIFLAKVMSHGPLALPCFMLIFFQSASSYANCQSSQSDVALWVKLPQSSILFWIFVHLQKQFREASTKPNHYKMVTNCGPNIKNMRERERERESLWVERWGKEIELKEVYGYGCVGKEIYCISLPTPPIPFISFGFFLSPLLSHLCITLFVNQQYYLFVLLSNDFISESSLSFSFAVCLFILYHFNRKLEKKKIIKIFNYFFLFLNFF